ncbi:MAG: Gfo/Idh/MocA family oxidoreductase [Pseudomonadota bacterium]
MTHGIALIGCGYIADSYQAAARHHRDRFAIRAVHDKNPERARAHAAHWSTPARPLDAILTDPDIALVANLTDPHNHEAVTRAAIAAGKHVYSEKPLAMNFGTAAALADAATAKGVRLASAPCNLLGEAARTLAKAVREGIAGKVRLIYAEMDDGMIHRAPYQNWANASGAPWPARGEFEVGCTFEHAGYTLGPLVAMFGPVRTVSAFSTLAIPDKQTTPPLENPAPDVSVACLTFDNGITARMTNSVVARYDHRLRLFGDNGTLTLAEPWSYRSPVTFTPQTTSRLGRIAERRLGWQPTKRIKPVGTPRVPAGRGQPTMDFCAGIRDLLDAIDAGRPATLTPELGVHITEVTEAAQHPERFARPYRVTTTVPPINLAG